LLADEGVPSDEPRGLQDRDITTDDSALADLERLGMMTTPVTVVDGQTVIGYDVNRLKTLLGL
jgi:hypothetical protein